LGNQTVFEQTQDYSWYNL